MSKRSTAIDCRRVELDGVWYVIVREAVFEALCKKAGVVHATAAPSDETLSSDVDSDRSSMAERILRRRTAIGLSQAELARRAGIRSETLNRIERGHTMPDFATVRKLVMAMNAVEKQHALSDVLKSSRSTKQEKQDGE